MTRQELRLLAKMAAEVNKVEKKEEKKPPVERATSAEMPAPQPQPAAEPESQMDSFDAGEYSGDVNPWQLGGYDLYSPYMGYYGYEEPWSKVASVKDAYDLGMKVAIANVERKLGMSKRANTLLQAARSGGVKRLMRTMGGTVEHAAPGAVAPAAEAASAGGGFMGRAQNLVSRSHSAPTAAPATAAPAAAPAASSAGGGFVERAQNLVSRPATAPSPQQTGVGEKIRTARKARQGKPSRPLRGDAPKQPAAPAQAAAPAQPAATRQAAQPGPTAPASPRDAYGMQTETNEAFANIPKPKKPTRLDRISEDARRAQTQPAQAPAAQPAAAPAATPAPITPEAAPPPPPPRRHFGWGALGLGAGMAGVGAGGMAMGAMAQGYRPSVYYGGYPTWTAAPQMPVYGGQI